VVGLCERFKCLPSALLKEDAGLLRLVRMTDLARKRDEVTEDGDGEWEPG
jgi:hypothetical protein